MLYMIQKFFQFVCGQCMLDISGNQCFCLSAVNT